MRLMENNTLQRVECLPKHLDDYLPLVPDVVEKIYLLAKPLQGLKVTHVNTTALGGGVAEMLRSIVPLQQDIGLNSNWYVIPPNDAFFEVTKEIHNFLQGKEGNLNHDQKKTYLEYNNFLADLLAEITCDVLIIHDPQPVAALTFLNNQKPPLAVWRCHIDTSTPNQKVWDFLLPYLKIYDHFVFTMKDFTHHNFPAGQISTIAPVIDPLATKNIAMEKEGAKYYVQRFGIDTNKPLITQVSRLDPWKDPQGVVDTYRLAKKEFPDLQLALVAQMANDDPEGEIIFQQIKKHIQDEKGIFVLVNLPNNDQAINAFQVVSDIILQKSVREGFGLTVTEAMWKKAVVIGGNVGGIKLQIEDGKNGFLVNSPKEAAEKIVYLLQNPKLKEEISQAAHESVKDKFLMPHNILNYLNLFSHLLGKKPLTLNSYLSTQLISP